LDRKVTRDNILPEELFDRRQCILPTVNQFLAYNYQNKGYQDSTEEALNYQHKNEDVGTKVAQSFYLHATVTAM
jgi:hypothetical protein